MQLIEKRQPKGLHEQSAEYARFRGRIFGRDSNVNIIFTLLIAFYHFYLIKVMDLYFYVPTYDLDV